MEREINSNEKEIEKGVLFSGEKDSTWSSSVLPSENAKLIDAEMMKEAKKKAALKKAYQTVDEIHFAAPSPDVLPIYEVLPEAKPSSVGKLPKPQKFTKFSVRRICLEVNKREKTSWCFYPPPYSHPCWSYLNDECWQGPEEWWDRAFKYIFSCDQWKWATYENTCTPFWQAFCAVKGVLSDSSAGKTAEKKRKSQKAIGISLLFKHTSRFGSTFAQSVWLSNEQIRAISNGEDVESLRAPVFCGYARNDKGETFARPCPVRPRHGFVDSRCIKVEKLSDLREICQETLAADPEGEMILMTPIEADFNLIATDSVVLIGRGNDGATSGKDVLTLPIVKGWKWTPIEKRALNIKPKETVFAEFVQMGSGKNILTQLRGGPSVPNSPNFVPRDVYLDRKYCLRTVKDNGAEKSLVEWESEVAWVKKQKDWQNFYTWHPKGSLACHFGIHCFLNDVPYLTGELVFNTTIKATSRAKPDKLDSRPFRSGFEKSYFPAQGCDYQFGYRQVEIILAGLHNFPALDVSESDQLEFFGLSCGIAVRLGLAACLGELRYAGRQTKKGESWVDGESSGGNLNRSRIYQNALSVDLNYILDKTHRTAPLYGFPKWFVGSGVGGLKWLECSKATFELWNSICVFLRSKLNSDLNVVVKTLNQIVNVCHNGSQLLSKFADTVVFNLGAVFPNLVLLKNASMIYEALKGERTAPKVAFIPFDLPKDKWDSGNIYNRRFGEKEEVPEEKASHCVYCDVGGCDGCEDHDKDEDGSCLS